MLCGDRIAGCQKDHSLTQQKKLGRVFKPGSVDFNYTEFSAGLQSQEEQQLKDCLDGRTES